MAAGAKPACSLCGEAITLFEHHAVACPSGRITAHDFLVHMLMQICKDAGASVQRERIIGIEGNRQLTSSFLLLQWTIPTAKGAIVYVTRIAPNDSPMSLRLHRSKSTARSLRQRNPTRKTNTRRPLHTSRMLLLTRLL